MKVYMYNEREGKAKRSQGQSGRIQDDGYGMRAQVWVGYPHSDRKSLANRNDHQSIINNQPTNHQQSTHWVKVHRFLAVGINVHV